MFVSYSQAATIAIEKPRRTRKNLSIASSWTRGNFTHAVDLVPFAEPGSEQFYDTFPHRRFAGYRLYPEPD